MRDETKCHFCLRREDEGIRVWGLYMCPSCQDDLIAAPVGGERYMYFLAELKKAGQAKKYDGRDA